MQWTKKSLDVYKMIEYIKVLLAEPMFQKVLAAFIGLAVIVVLARIIRGTITRYVGGVDTRYRLRKFANIGAYVTFLLMLTIVFSDRLGNLTVAMGVAGAGVAFALQEVIASFAGWFAVVFAGFYKPGDRVQLGGIKGDVIDISFLRTTLMELGEWVEADLYTGRVVRVANSFVFKEPVFNYSGEFPFLWDEIKIPVKHGSDHVLARQILKRVAQAEVAEYCPKAEESWKSFSKQFMLDEASLEPRITLTANDNWMEFTIRYVVDFKLRRLTKDHLFTLVLDEFQKTEGKVKFASTTLQLVDPPVISVNLKNQ